MPRASRAASIAFARTAIDTMGELPDGTKGATPTSCAPRCSPIRRPFVQNVTERLLMYALGRVIEAHDMPFVRDIAPVRRRQLQVLDAHHQHRAQRRFHQAVVLRRRTPLSSSRPRSSQGDDECSSPVKTSFLPDDAAGAGAAISCRCLMR
jgi:hypothetical protein